MSPVGTTAPPGSGDYFIRNGSPAQPFSKPFRDLAKEFVKPHPVPAPTIMRRATTPTPEAEAPVVLVKHEPLSRGPGSLRSSSTARREAAELDREDKVRDAGAGMPACMC